MIDGRFRRGYITRHYGRPGLGVQAVQIELAQCAYMDEAHPDTWDDTRAAPLQALLKSCRGAQPSIARTAVGLKVRRRSQRKSDRLKLLNKR